MFGTIRRHQTWLWVVISTLTIISFVYYFGPQSKVSQGRGGAANLGTINGERITPEEYDQTRREVYLRYFFMSGTFPNEESRKMGFDEYARHDSARSSSECTGAAGKCRRTVRPCGEASICS